jgi:hypothetical protein
MFVLHLYVFVTVVQLCSFEDAREVLRGTFCQCSDMLRRARNATSICALMSVLVMQLKACQSFE